MAEKPTLEKAANFAEKIDRFITVATAIPVFGGMLKNVFDKTAEKASKKVEEVFGLSASEASKVFDDEIDFRRALIEGGFTEPEKKSLLEWLGRLRKSDPKLASEFTRWIHNAIQKLSKEIKPKKGPGSIDSSVGVAVAASLMRDILNASDDAERIEILLQMDIKTPPARPTPWIKTKSGEVWAEQQGNAQKLNTEASTFESWAKQFRDKQRS